MTMYCAEGSFLAVSCPNGYWTPWTGAYNENDCITCERGSWCNFFTMSSDATFIAWMVNNPSWTLTTIADGTTGIPSTLNTYYGACSDGYICLEGCTSSTPTSSVVDGGYPCPIGHYCESGDKIERPCKPGTYQDAT